MTVTGVGLQNKGKVSETMSCDCGHRHPGNNEKTKLSPFNESDEFLVKCDDRQTNRTTDQAQQLQTKAEGAD